MKLKRLRGIFGGLIIIYLIEPAIRFCIEKSNQKNGNIFTVLLGSVFIVDLGLRPFLGSNFTGYSWENICSDFTDITVDSCMVKC